MRRRISSSLASRGWGLLAALVLIFAAPSVHAEDELTPRQILDKSLDENGLAINSGKARIKLSVHKKGKVDVKEMTIESKEEGDDTKSRLVLSKPADIAGEAYLFLGHKDREDDVYMYLPAFSKTRKVAGSDKNGSFLGTHMTFRDLESRDLESGEAKRNADEKIGPHDCYVVESTPGADEDSEYSKVISWVRKKDYMPLRVEFYGEDGKRVKRMFSEKISKKDGVRYVKKLSIFTEDDSEKTVMEILDVDFNANLPDKTFSKDALGQ